MVACCKQWSAFGICVCTKASADATSNVFQSPLILRVPYLDTGYATRRVRIHPYSYHPPTIFNGFRRRLHWVPFANGHRVFSALSVFPYLLVILARIRSIYFPSDIVVRFCTGIMVGNAICQVSVLPSFAPGWKGRLLLADGFPCCGTLLHWRGGPSIPLVTWLHASAENEKTKKYSHWFWLWSVRFSFQLVPY